MNCNCLVSLIITLAVRLQSWLQFRRRFLIPLLIEKIFYIGHTAIQIPFRGIRYRRIVAGTSIIKTERHLQKPFALLQQLLRNLDLRLILRQFQIL